MAVRQANVGLVNGARTWIADLAADLSVNPKYKDCDIAFITSADGSNAYDVYIYKIGLPGWVKYIDDGAAVTAWQLTGDSGTNPSTNFIGTSDVQGLSIRTNSIEAIRVDSNQKIGIGTSTLVGGSILTINGGNVSVNPGGSIYTTLIQNAIGHGNIQLRDSSGVLIVDLWGGSQSDFHQNIQVDNQVHAGKIGGNIGAFQVIENVNGYTISALQGNAQGGYLLLKDSSNVAQVELFGSGNNYINSGRLGIGIYTTPQGKVHIVGEGSTSATYSLKIDDSSSQPIIYANDARHVGIGQDSDVNATLGIGPVTADTYLLHVNGNAGNVSQAVFEGSKYGVYIKTQNDDADKHALTVLNSSGNSILHATNARNVAFNTSSPTSTNHLSLVGYAGWFNGIDISGGYAGGGAAINIVGPTTTTYTGIRMTHDSSNSEGINITVNGNNGNRGIIVNASGGSSYNYALVSTDGLFGFGTLVPNAKTHIVGVGATSATNSFYVQNSAGRNLILVSDDVSIGVTFGNALQGDTGVHADVGAGGTLKVGSPSITNAKISIYQAGGYGMYGMYLDSGSPTDTSNNAAYFRSRSATGADASGLTIESLSSGGSGSNSAVGLYVSASGADHNYAITVPSGGGNIGFGANPFDATKLRVVAPDGFDTGIAVTHSATSLYTAYGVTVDMTSSGSSAKIGINLNVTNGSAFNRAINVSGGDVVFNTGFGLVAVNGGTVSGTLINVGGLGSTSATYSLDIFNSSAETLFAVRDDKKASFGAGISPNASYYFRTSDIADDFGVYQLATNVKASSLAHYINATGANGFDGFQIDATQVTGTLRAILGIAHSSGTSTNNTGGYFSARNADGVSIGVKGIVAGGGSQASSETYGVYGQNGDQLSLLNHAIYANQTGGIDSSVNYGFRTDVGISGNNTTNYGLRIAVTNLITATGVTNYGIRINVINGANNYAIVTDGGNIGFGTLTPDASALLDMTSTTQGFLPPRMTGAQAEAIPTPATGLMVYATVGNGVTITSTGWWGWDGATWVKLN